jgi:hypothetical protein
MASPLLSDPEMFGLSVAKVFDWLNVTVAPVSGVPRRVTVAVSLSLAPFAAGVVVAAVIIRLVGVAERSGATWVAKVPV